jgi:ribose 5-phosphate isomerase RpiB
MRVVASDHAGFALTEILKGELTGRGHEVADLGTGNGDDSVDYPDFGAAVGRIAKLAALDHDEGTSSP